MIVITPKRVFEVPLETACINCDVFAGKTVKEIAAMPITEGKENITMGTLSKSPKIKQ